MVGEQGDPPTGKGCDEKARTTGQEYLPASTAGLLLLTNHQSDPLVPTRGAVWAPVNNMPATIACRTGANV
ncbi:hypothetical protein GCM10025734_78540 [Kitasatospora paranensis]